MNKNAPEWERLWEYTDMRLNIQEELKEFDMYYSFQKDTSSFW